MGEPRLPNMGEPRLPNMGEPRLPNMGEPRLPIMGEPRLPNMGEPRVPEMGSQHLPTTERPEAYLGTCSAENVALALRPGRRGSCGVEPTYQIEHIDPCHKPLE